MQLHDMILQALDCAIASSEWEVADILLRATEELCARDETDTRLIAAYKRITPDSTL